MTPSPTHPAVPLMWLNLPPAHVLPHEWRVASHPEDEDVS